ncbi:MAG: hypothetical protein ACRCX2_21320 [Paraclostridium sp.]
MANSIQIRLEKQDSHSITVTVVEDICRAVKLEVLVNNIVKYRNSNSPFLSAMFVFQHDKDYVYGRNSIIVKVTDEKGGETMLDLDHYSHKALNSVSSDANLDQIMVQVKNTREYLEYLRSTLRDILETKGISVEKESNIDRLICQADASLVGLSEKYYNVKVSAPHDIKGGVNVEYYTINNQKLIKTIDQGTVSTIEVKANSFFIMTPNGPARNECNVNPAFKMSIHNKNGYHLYGYVLGYLNID